MNTYTFYFEEGDIIVREFDIQNAILVAQSKARDEGWNDKTFLIGHIEFGGV